MGPGRRSSRSGRPPRGAERDPRARPRAGAARPHDGLALHVLPRRREDHGGGPEGHSAVGPRRPTLRRCPPLELRGVRLAGADAALRLERLRRDPPRALRVRRGSARRELHDRRAEQRLQQGDAREATEASIAAYRTAMAEFAQMRTLDVWYSRLDADAGAREGVAEATKRERRMSRSGEKIIEKAGRRTACRRSRS